jgi:hypothetical protein
VTATEGTRRVATYVINKSYDSEQTVEADTYLLRDGYFWFGSQGGPGGVQTFTIRQERVETITLQG